MAFWQNRSISLVDMYIDNSEPTENVGQIHFSLEYDFQNTTLILKIMQVSYAAPCSPSSVCFYLVWRTASLRGSGDPAWLIIPRVCRDMSAYHRTRRLSLLFLFSRAQHFDSIGEGKRRERDPGALLEILDAPTAGPVNKDHVSTSSSNYFGDVFRSY